MKKVKAILRKLYRFILKIFYPLFVLMCICIFCAIKVEELLEWIDDFLADKESKLEVRIMDKFKNS